MSKPQVLPKPPSLAQLFDAPEGFVGNCGWLCGYTADAAFLNEAVERFVRQTEHQRAHLGRAALAVMLDPSNAQISPIDAPGVVHLAYRSERLRPFRLLHAKVAVLGYRSETDPTDWLLRTIVSTGNWTRATLEQNLDLAWHFDLSAQGPKDQDDTIPQARADVRAVWDLLSWLREFFDIRVLTDVPAGRDTTETRDASKWFEELLGGIPSPRGLSPRVFDNRQTALLDQLPKLVETHSSSVARNYLGMGSGFFESAREEGKIPRVLERVAEVLQGAGLLTKSPEVDLFVNPRGCQAVAGSLEAIRERKWSVREAYKPGFFSDGEVRALHAKFLLSANRRTHSNLCSSAWVYLGSGNLTSAGFTQRMSHYGGNLEAGVVFAPEKLHWQPGRVVPPDQVVSYRLPVQWFSELSEDESLVSGNPFVLPGDTFLAPPLPFLLWDVDGDQGLLKGFGPVEVQFEVLDSAEVACACKAPMLFVWPGEQPRQVLVRWVLEDGTAQRAQVPVLDGFGRLAATVLPPMEVDEVWRQLQSFPIPPDDEDILPLDDPPPDPDRTRSTDGVLESRSGDYPIRRMMELVESIADRQTSVLKVDWPAWCIRLEQSLCQAAGSRIAGCFREWGINPLSPLWHSAFRPQFAESNEQMEGSAYQKALERVEVAWGMSGLKPLGAAV